jgi:DNA-binding LacI/PurR family transcriptional regulator
MASKLRSRRTGVIGVVIPLGSARRRNISDPFFLALLGHLAEELTQRGYDLMLSCALPDGTADWLERMTGSGMVDGVLVIGQSDQLDVIERVARSYQPLVVWGQYRAGQAHLAVAPDNEMGGRIAAEHLIACGARKIAFLGENTSIEVAMRHVGASAAAKAAGLELLHLPISLADEEMQGQLAAHFGNGNPDIDGIVGASDLIALRAMQVLHRLGRVVPDDIQIVGFDDLPVASLSEPALTTIRQDFPKLAEAAIKLLAEARRGATPRNVLMPVELVRRQTT